MSGSKLGYPMAWLTQFRSLKPKRSCCDSESNIFAELGRTLRELRCNLLSNAASTELSCIYRYWAKLHLVSYASSFWASMYTLGYDAPYWASCNLMSSRYRTELKSFLVVYRYFLFMSRRVVNLHLIYLKVYPLSYSWQLGEWNSGSWNIWHPVWGV